jgi:VanZ family protein
MPAIAWMLLIFPGSTDALSAERTSRVIVLSLRWLDPDISWAAINTIHTLIRKPGHVSEYAILAVVLWRAVEGGQSFRAKTPILCVLVWLTCALFAASDEFHQSLVPHARHRCTT